MLEGFHPAVRAWFETRYGTPTEPQALGWPRIQSGQDTLIAAPTGSGKTLAAFLACLDAMIRGAKTHAYYIHGDTKFTTEAYGIENPKFFAAIDAVRNAAGNIVCRITITNPGRMDDCVPLNIIGVGNAPAVAQTYVRGYSIWEATNKMDLVAYSQHVFDNIAHEFHQYAETLGFETIYPLPLSAVEGDNVVRRSANTTWFHGLALLKYLEDLPLQDDNNMDGAVRFPVQYVIRPDSAFRGFSGELVSGTLRPGDKIMALPSGRTTRIQSIITDY